MTVAPTKDIRETWTAIMRLRNKETRTHGCANTLTKDEVTTIIATMDFFGTSDAMLRQIVSDLLWARYRVFDCLATNIDGLRGRKDDPDYQSAKTGLKVIAYAFLKADGDIDKFIADLRETDYQIDESWECISMEGT